MIVYSTEPVDDWTGWHKPEELWAMSSEEAYSGIWRERWEEQLSAAMKEAAQMGGDGDFAVGPLATILPSPAGGPPLFVIGWKQHTNGATFFASPVRLPWIAALADATSEEDHWHGDGAPDAPSEETQAEIDDLLQPEPAARVDH